MKPFSMVYVFSPYGFPPLLVGLLVALLGFGVFIREHRSRISVVFLALCCALATWLTAIGIAYFSATELLALAWTKIANIGVVCIPTLMFHFALVASKRLPRYRSWLMINYLFDVLFAFAISFNMGFLSGLWRYPWGHYGHYGPASVPFLFLCAYQVAASLHLLHQDYPESPAGRQRNRSRSFWFAFCIGSVGAVDLLPAYGVPLYPFGYLPVLAFVCLIARAIWLYRLADITPSFIAQDVITTMPSGLLVLDGDGIIRLVNGAMCALVERPEAFLLDKKASEAIPGFLPSERLQQLIGQGVFRNYEQTLVFPNGSKRILLLSLSRIRQTTKDTDAGFICVAEDITTRQNAEEALRHSEARFRRIVESNIIGFMIVDLSGKLLEANDALLKMLDYTQDDLKAGRVGGPALTPPEYRAMDEWSLKQLKTTGYCPPFEKEYYRRDGTRWPVLVGSVLIQEPTPHCVCFVIDASDRRRAQEALQRAYDELEKRVDERTKDLSFANRELQREIARRKLAEEKLRNLSLQDPLTGLNNRRGFLALADQHLLRATRDKREFLLFFVDVDGLKQINDTLGHARGDQALIQVGDVLRETFRKSDILARIGGDEFAVVADADAEHVDTYINRLKKQLEEANARQQFPFLLSLSIGTAVFDLRRMSTIQELMKEADLNLYTYKRQHHQFGVKVIR